MAKWLQGLIVQADQWRVLEMSLITGAMRTALILINHYYYYCCCYYCFFYYHYFSYSWFFISIMPFKTRYFDESKKLKLRKVEKVVRMKTRRIWSENWKID